MDSETGIIENMIMLEEGSDWEPPHGKVIKRTFDKDDAFIGNRFDFEADDFVPYQSPPDPIPDNIDEILEDPKVQNEPEVF